MYNYREELKSDIYDAIDCGSYDTIDYDVLYDLMWVDDSITGNASGSYTFNRETAKNYVMDNMEIAVEAYREFDCVDSFATALCNEDYELIDVTIRCFLLGECLRDVLDDYDFE